MVRRQTLGASERRRIDMVTKKLAGKVALVTGGTSGIGLATAERFAAEGAQVFITGRRQSELDAAAKQFGANVTGVRGDVANLGDLDQLYDVIKQKSGRLDVLFANAGGGEFLPLGQITEAHFDKWFGINVKGLLFSVQKALPLMPDGASIILNASIVSVKGMPAFSVYSATKAAVRSFARTWSVDLKDRKIRVNAVSPGVIITPAYSSLMSDEQIEQYKASTSASAPLGRPGTPDEIAKAVVFLASDDSSYVTGIELFVDGGMAQI
jgi:NAD(P)-dependent dehydrogenase (short-subunit alcohol dehydrogenase family)